MTPQKTIAHYRITSKLGEGGMGAVYRGTDTKLGREVAIKVLPEAFANDPDRLARFTREAQVLASLNHPNIAAIYGIEEQSLVMELVEGPTLAERIAAGPVAPDEALAIVHQLIDALEYAHEKGVIHRDLKPANVKITPEGKAKVLDFGLAKALDSHLPKGDSVSSPTLTMQATMVGTVLGTAAYMAPEQARGQNVDERADIWAFGVVVYEMVTGRALFSRPSLSDTLAAVLKDEPDWTPVPRKFLKLLHFCTVRDPRRRLRDIGDARLLLNDSPEPVAGAMVPSKGAMRWVVGVLALGLIVTGALLWRATRRIGSPLTRLTVDLGPDVVAGSDFTVGISPDGRRLVFPIRGVDGKQLLATRLLEESQPTLLSGTENGIDPFFSPDGQSVGFFSDAKLKVVSVHGGLATSVCASVNPRGASWGQDGNIIVARGLRGPLARVPATGGTPQVITKLLPGEATHRWPQILPDGKGILFTASANTIGLEDGSIEVLSFKTGVVKTLQRGGYFGRVLPSGHLVYVHKGTLYGVGFDPDRLETLGTPVPLLENIAANSLTGAGQLAFSAVGSGPDTFVYLEGKAAPQKWQIAWLDSTGQMKPLIATPGEYLLPRFSPDGRKLLFFRGDVGIQIYDLERETIARVPATLGGRVMTWAADSKHIFIAEGRSISWIRSDGSGGAQTLSESKNAPVPFSVSRDGRWLAYHDTDLESASDIWVLPVDTTDPDHPKTGKPQAFLRTPSNELAARFSPDGRWMAYRSDETGNNEIWVAPFPTGSGAEKSQVSVGGGLYAIWSNNRRELFYETPDHRIMVVDYAVNGGSFKLGKPRIWSDRQFFYPGVSNWDLAPDGRRFAVLTVPDSGSAPGSSVRVTMLFNYFDELKRKLP